MEKERFVGQPGMPDPPDPTSKFGYEDLHPNYWRQCFNAAWKILTSKAASKGYMHQGEILGSTNSVYRMVEAAFEGHPGGEVIYKLLRYKAKRDPEDLAKAAAWIALMYAAHHESPTGLPMDVGDCKPYQSESYQTPDVSYTEALSDAQRFAAMLAQEGFGSILDVMAEIEATKHRSFPINADRRGAILVEEALEVLQQALALDRYDAEAPEAIRTKLRAELVQLAATAVRWINRLDGTTARSNIKEI